MGRRPAPAQSPKVVFSIRCDKMHFGVSVDIGGGEVEVPAIVRHIGMGVVAGMQPGKSAGMPGAIAGGTGFRQKKGLDG